MSDAIKAFIFFSLILISVEEDLLYGYVDRRKIYGVYMIEDLENWVLIIAGPEGIEINATFDLSQIIIIKGIIIFLF